MRPRRLVLAASVALITACSPDPKIIEAAILSGLFVGSPPPAVVLARQLCGENVPLLDLNITTVKVTDVDARSGSGTATLHIDRGKRTCKGRVAYNYTVSAKYVRTIGWRARVSSTFVAHDYRVIR